MEFSHISVLLYETVDSLNVKKDGVYVDCTLGGAGHTSLILSKIGENGRVIGIDRDDDALENAKNKINDPRLITVKDNFENIKDAVARAGFERVDGILMDLGVSSHQLDVAERGFSYIKDAPLDMRMDQTAPLTAYDVVNGYSERELIRILRDYGEERFAPRIAQRICTARESAPIKNTLELAEIISAAIPQKYRYESGNPAKRSFQAIRIEVNGELDCIPKAIEEGAEMLNVGGRMSIISFHSLEDRLVKNGFQKLEKPCTCPSDFPVCVCGKKQSVKIITRKPILPSKEELEYNSRSHSAKLRVCEKI
ncbi:MAG: 16S rRNA (cytosine(1402)-N(4))-methyltransferase RsmH [Clostridia bacterium]|nr:16S rRNA (cytosine(1402)-N(4))-methyltransferase RsmH [Clostridia bacterium]MBO5785956.1 16S rRNA (cytosine(1402)-N(4))-methyltransferase RsmH [Clostridia bacterium]